MVMDDYNNFATGLQKTEDYSSFYDAQFVGKFKILKKHETRDSDAERQDWPYRADGEVDEIFIPTDIDEFVQKTILGKWNMNIMRLRLMFPQAVNIYTDEDAKVYIFSFISIQQ